MYMPIFYWWDDEVDDDEIVITNVSSDDEEVDEVWYNVPIIFYENEIGLYLYELDELDERLETEQIDEIHQ